MTKILIKQKRKFNYETSRLVAFLFAVLFLFILQTLTSQAAFNKEINYQGKLTTSAGVAVSNGTYNMEFKLYTAGSTVVWTETRTSTDKVQVTNGLFSVMLGSVNPLTGIDFNQTLYLGVNIGGTGTPGWDGEMSPRKKLGVVPAAIQAEIAAVTNNFVGGNSTTLLGSLPYQSDTNTTSLLSPNITTTKKFLRMTGTGTNGAVPAWDTLVAADIPTLDQNTTGSANSLKSPLTTGLVTIRGMTAGTTRAKTVNDTDDTILELTGSYTPTGTWTSLKLNEAVALTTTSTKLNYLTGATGTTGTATGKIVFDTTPTLVTPILGVATGTSLDVSGVLESGTNTGTGGKLTLLGATSGSAALQVAAAAGTGTIFQLPASNGSNTNILQTNGAGVTSWVAAGLSNPMTNIGDMIIGGTSGAPGRLADVAAGQPLLSGGVNTAPGYAGYTFTATSAQTYTFPTTSKTLMASDYSNAGTAPTWDQNTTGYAANVAGGLGGQVLYQSAVNTTAKLANGTAGQVLSSQGTTLAPQWITAPIKIVNTSNLFSDTAGTGVTTTTHSNFIGTDSGDSATAASDSNFMGQFAGNSSTNASNSNFFGQNAGSYSNDASNSNFFGTYAGNGTDAMYSNFLGYYSGSNATNAYYSNFFGKQAGYQASSASYSNLFGYQTGRFFTGNDIGSNNIIIGTNISLPNATANAMNLGGVLFAKNTYGTTTGNPSIAATSTGSVGVGIVSPTARLHLAAGTATAGTAPLKLSAGTNLTTTEAGAIEYDGSHLYFTVSDAGTRYQLDQQGGGMSNPMTNIGDMIIGGTAGAPAILADVASGQPLLSGGVNTAPGYAGYTFAATAAQTYTFPTTSKTLMASDYSNAGTAPTWDQNTTGSANSLKSPLTTGLVTIRGMTAGTTRAKTVNDTDDTILELTGSYTPTGTWTSLKLNEAVALTTTSTKLNYLTGATGTTGTATGKIVFDTTPTFITSVIGGATFSAFNTVTTNLSLGGAATTLTIGGTPTTAITHNYSTNATASGITKTINFGTGGAAGSTTNINIGSSIGGTTTVSSPTLASSGVITSGVNGTTGGQLTLNGATSGSGVIKVNAAAGTGIVFQLPSSNGSNTNILSTNGAGVTSWVAAPVSSQWTTATNDIYYNTGRVFVGSTSEATSISKLALTGTNTANGSTAGVIGILGNYTFNNAGASNFVQVGNRLTITNSPTTNPNTAVGEFIRVVDNSGLANLVRGIDITSNAGNNTAGTNTGLRANGATFGVQAITTALAGSQTIPAALFAQNTGDTNGDILRLYSNSVTSAPSFATFYHDTTTFTGTGLLMDFATSSGGFTGNFADFQKNNVSLFKVTNAGIVSMGLSATASTTALCSSLGNSPATPAAGTAYEIRDCSGAPVADYAEMYPIEKDITYGEIVTTGSELVNTYDTSDGGINWDKVKGQITKLTRSTQAYQNNVIGIVSDNRGDFSSVGYNIKDTDNPMPVALNGRVPVKISTTSESIKAGDYLTTSSEAGRAMRATKAGFVIGKALEDWDANSGKDSLIIFVEQGFYNGDSFSDFAGIDIDTELVDKDKVIAKFILEKLISDKENSNINPSEVYTDKIIAGLEIITPTITTDNLSVEGETTFGGLVYFNATAEFAKSIIFNDVAEFTVPPLFNSDTAGFAVIKKDAKSVRIDFENPYIGTPIVNTDITFDRQKIADGREVTSFDSDSFFSHDILSIVTDKDETGFTIVINKKAPMDINFSWVALSVRDPKIFESVIDGLVILDSEKESKSQVANTEENIEEERQTASVADAPTGFFENILGDTLVGDFLGVGDQKEYDDNIAVENIFEPIDTVGDSLPQDEKIADSATPGIEKEVPSEVIIDTASGSIN